MDKSQHWERIYNTKSHEQMSWHAPHLATSLEWISQAAPSHHASIIDVGGGASTLVDDLLASGFDNLTVADISGTAITQSQSRLGSASANINWIVGDITSVSLPQRAFDIWHDRAVFHFLVHPGDRSAYRKQLAHALKPDGQLILAVFSTNGPQTCSGLPVARYDVQSIQQEFAPHFRLLKSAILPHQTPSGATQEFLYCHIGRAGAAS